jgi:hypothetical protein
MRTSIASTLVLTAACRKVEPAPEDLDGLLGWTWANYDVAEDADVRAAALSLIDVAAITADSDALRGSATDLTPEVVAGFGPPGTDIAAARGFYLVKAFPCALPDLDPVLYHVDQPTLYPDAGYDAYDRQYTTDLNAYVERAAPTIGWDIALTATILGATYSEDLHGGLRWVPADGDEPAVILQRTWMPTEAVFEDGSSKTFTQDYQIELYVEQSPGEVIHLYGIWREMELGVGLTMDSDLAVNTTLNNLEDWDDRTSELCLEPPW